MFRTGDKVRYHAVIGGKHDGATYTVRGVGALPSGEAVAWLSRKRGCVAMRALSAAPKASEATEGER